MKCTILHESRGRLRVHVCNVRMTLHRADVLEAYLNHHDAVSKAKVYERTGDVVVYYTGARKDAVAALSTYRFDDPELDALVTVVQELGVLTAVPTPFTDALLGLARLQARVKGLY